MEKRTVVQKFNKSGWLASLHTLQHSEPNDTFHFGHNPPPMRFTSEKAPHVAKFGVLARQCASWNILPVLTSMPI